MLIGTNSILYDARHYDHPHHPTAIEHLDDVFRFLAAVVSESEIIFDNNLCNEIQIQNRIANVPIGIINLKLHYITMAKV